MELRFEFEQLMLPEFGEGVLFYGEATLVDNHGETDTFIVKDIKLGDKWLPHVPRGGPRTIGTCLFEAIAAVLYDDRVLDKHGNPTVGFMAASAWSDFVSGETPVKSEAETVVPMFKNKRLMAQLVEGAHL